MAAAVIFPPSMMTVASMSPCRDVPHPVKVPSFHLTFLLLSAVAGAGDEAGAGAVATVGVATTGAGAGVTALVALDVLVAPVTLGAPASATKAAAGGTAAAGLATLSGSTAGDADDADLSASPLAPSCGALSVGATTTLSEVIATGGTGAEASRAASFNVPLGIASGPATGTRRRGALRAASSVAAASVRT